MGLGLLALQSTVAALQLAVTPLDPVSPVEWTAQDPHCPAASLRGSVAGRYQIWALQDTEGQDCDRAGFKRFDVQSEPDHLIAVTYPTLDSAMQGRKAPAHLDWARQLKTSVQQALVALHSEPHQQSQQQVFGLDQPDETAIRLLGQHQDLLLYGVQDQWLPTADTFFPPLAHLTLLPKTSSHISDGDARLEPLLPLQYSPAVDRVLSTLTTEPLQTHVHWLTGENPKSPIYTRHSVSQGARDAAVYIQDRITQAGGNCSLEHFQQGFAPNVVCHFASANQNTDETVLVSAHYDSRGTFGSVPAPGADDDGSGTAVLLSLAQVLARNHLQFDRHVMLVAFAGEEQGLVGSRALAHLLRQQKDAAHNSSSRTTDLVFALQMDMLAYRAPGEPLSMGLPDKIGSSVARELVRSAATLYTPQLRTGLTPACCSDHQSFHESGFPATWVFERPGPIADPQYHQSGDKSDREGCEFASSKDEKSSLDTTWTQITLAQMIGSKCEPSARSCWRRCVM